MLKLPKISSQKLLYLAALSFIFVASFAMSTYRLTQKEIKTIFVKADAETGTENFAPIPILIGSNNAPEIMAKSAYAKDLESGVTLFAKNPDEQLFPASTTKILTAMTALDYYDLDEVVKVSNINVVGQKMRLIEGEEISVSDLIQGLLIFSANDAAEVLAANYCATGFGDFEVSLEKPGERCGRQYFIDAMNAKAEALHLKNSNFKNPTGLDNLGHLTTAGDLAILAAESMKNPIIKDIVGTKDTTVASIDGRFKHRLVNLNELVGKVEGVLGIKTGWTESAGENLVTFVERGEKKVVIVVLGSEDRFGETKSLIEWIYENYEWKDVNLIK